MLKLSEDDNAKGSHRHFDAGTAKTGRAEIVHATEDLEVLASILGNYLPEDEAADVAFELLSEFGNFPAVMSQPYEVLRVTPGVTPVVANSILNIDRAVKLVIEKRILKRPALNNWNSIEAFCRAFIGFRPQQNIMAIYLDDDYCPIRSEHLARGTVNRVVTYPREIVARSLRLGASSIIVAKNVPSGRMVPNASELILVEQLKQACSLLDIEVVDCVLVGKTGVGSMMRA